MSDTNNQATWEPKFDAISHVQEQLAQLIGYSLSGFSELSYVSDEVYNAAAAMAGDGLSEHEARLDVLRATLSDLKMKLREPIAKLYGMHPDDLGSHQ